MKKIVNIIILLVFCLFPVIGNAKTSVSYEWKLDDNAIITSKNGNYYFLSAKEWVINTFSKEGDLIATKDFSRLFYDYTYDELTNEKVASRLYELNSVPMHYNSEIDEYYSVRYEDGYCHVYDKERDIDFFTTYTFEDNLDYIKELVGYEFEIYEDALNDNFSVKKISKEGDYYLVYGYDADDNYAVRIYDDNTNIRFEKIDDDNNSFMLHIDNNKIYFLNESTFLEIYDMDGNLLDSFILAEHITESFEGYENKSLEFFNFDVFSNNIVVSYLLFDQDPVNDLPTSSINDLAGAAMAELLSLKFRLKYDIDVPEKTQNGKVNLENKIDENDREYVELEMVPDPGYSVGKVSVTDSYGGEIEVTNSKFFMPNSDVKVDVEFIKGEYLPIPDTGLGKSITLILIGTILIGLGLYTFNFVRQE